MMNQIAKRLMLAGLLTGVGLWAQAPTEFEAASIKPAAPMEPGRMMIGMRGGPGTPSPGQMTFINVSIAQIMQKAYDVKSYQISGPDWMSSARFDISARVPAGTTKAQFNVMLQNLLADRFKLVLHHSTKESSIYALLVAKGGPKLKESAKESTDDAVATPLPGGQRMDGPGRGMMDGPGRGMMGKDGMPQLPPGTPKGTPMIIGEGQMIAPGGKIRMIRNGATIGQFLDVLANQLDRPVRDMTGLSGTYDITLDFAVDPSIMQAKMAAMGGGPPPPEMASPEGATQDPSGAATIFSALTEQLGLRLEARKGPVDLLVIDSVQKTPTEN
jgi:uncharacterized protein (TIGR03435 family)